MNQTFSRLLLITLLFLGISEGFAQQGDKPIGDAERYTIGEIEVTGSESFNERTVIAFTGLKEGEKIYVPGERISRIVKKLWDLKLFSDINIYITDIQGSTVTLEINIAEVPNLSEVDIRGVKKNKAKDLKEEIKLTAGRKVTQSFIANTRSFIENKYRDKGYLNADVSIRTREAKDTITQGRKKVDMLIDIDKGERVKIASIDFEGNELIKDSRLRRAMKNTKEKNFFRILKRSKYVEEEYQEDLKSVIDLYKERGFRDARVVEDSLSRVNENLIALDIKIEEGNKYYFGDIEFVGNTVYTDQQLKQKLGIDRGDVYNGIEFDKRISDPTDPDSDDLSNMYQNNGYLFSNINAVETNVQNDTIDFEIRIVEGPETYFKNIEVTGNTRTNDHVVYRILRTRPGEKYSREKIVRSVREIGQLTFFDATQINPVPKNFNAEDGTVDIEYQLVEAGSSQIELQGGYGGGGFVGTLGLRFNNFSLRNLFNGEAWQPLPMGDGQTVALRAQASQAFNTYSLSFTEPWLGGKKPVSFSVSLSHSEQYNFRRGGGRFGDVDRNSRILITGGTIGLAKILEWPDNYFQISHAVAFRHYNLKNFNFQTFNFPNGYSNDISYTLGITRNNAGTNPIFPTYGSTFNLTAKLTPPYSLFNDVDYSNLGEQPEFQTNGLPDPAKIDQERFKFLEYYKIKFNAAWYTTLVGKLVLKSGGEFGYLGAYNTDRGVVPFERFFVGGDGLGGFNLAARDIIRLRGYEFGQLNIDSEGDNIYNKLSFELRYPIILSQAASIFALTFAEAGASYNGFRNYNPYEMYRSTGAGIRIFMPQFGLLGIDFGYGFDSPPTTITDDPSGWQVHFLIGQQF